MVKFLSISIPLVIYVRSKAIKTFVYLLSFNFSWGE